MNRGLVMAGVSVWTGAMVCAPTCAADPDVPVPPDPAAAQAASTPEGVTPPAPTGSPVADACGLFNAAVNVAAANYEDFAYATAGTGNSVDYQDPTVSRTNLVGRTALRQAAAAAMSASRTPGLPPEVADPMRSWSLRATKLVLLMGLHGGGDSLNTTATDLNKDSQEALMACAANKGR